MRFTREDVKLGKSFMRKDGRVYYLSSKSPAYTRSGNKIYLRSIRTDECWADGIVGILQLLNNPSFGFTPVG